MVDGIYGVLPEKAQGVLERVQNNGQHLLALINDVLDLAKIEAGQLTLTIEDYALPEVVRSVVTATEPLATAKGLKFTTDVQDNMPMAHGDARRVSQVLLNLVGNAITVELATRAKSGLPPSLANGQFALEVRDTGPGITDADEERLIWRIPADRQFEHAQKRRHRIGVGDLQTHGRNSGRHDLGGIHPGTGIDIPRRLAGGSREPHRQWRRVGMSSHRCGIAS